MLDFQQKLVFSDYIGLYDVVVPKNHLLRKINELVDFGFIYDELIEKYCPDNGRMAIDPLRMFKYLLLKVIFDLSDVDIVERSRYDMSFKFFLGMTPEEEPIHPSSLTKFRKQRLKDIGLLDLLIGKTVQIALEKGVIKATSMIVDATHTHSRYHLKPLNQVLIEQGKKLRQSVYGIDTSLKTVLPKANPESELDEIISDCRELLDIVKMQEPLIQYPAIAEKMRKLEELLSDDAERHFSSDGDAKVGYKAADNSFFGYKTHIAMTEERIITAATISTGERNDGKELEKLYQKSVAAGLKVETIIGDSAYSGQDNLDFARENKIKLVSKLNPTITHGTRRKGDELEYNKDAGMYVCKAGHLAIKKKKRSKGKNKNPALTYFFDIKKCKSCPQREGCYKEGAKSKIYSITLKRDKYITHMDFEKSEYFKKKAKERYKIEAKNGELKNRHGYGTAKTSGLVGMELQGAITLFAVNLKRIVKLIEER